MPLLTAVRMKTFPLTGKGSLFRNLTRAENNWSPRNKILAKEIQSLGVTVSGGGTCLWAAPLLDGIVLLADAPELGIRNSPHGLSWITTLLMSKVSPVLLCGSYKTVTPYVGFDMALPSREGNLLGLLKPFPSCLRFLTRICFVPGWGLWHAQCAFVRLARGWAFKGQEGLCWKLYKMAENMAYPLPVPYQKLWKSALFLLIRTKHNSKHRQVMVRDSSKYISENYRQA